MKEKTSGRAPIVKLLRGILIFWTLFIGVGALCGGVCMLIKPDGSILQMQSLLPYFEVLPFSDVLFRNYVFPGISLIIVNGISQITAFVMIVSNRRKAPIAGMICGMLLMLWICIQFIIFEFNWLSTSYFIFGLLEMLTALFLCRAELNR